MTSDGLVAFRRAPGIEGVQLVPDLADSLPVPADGGTTYTFRLRPSLHYSNGESVRAQDFKRAIERVFEAQPPSPGAGLYGAIVGADRCEPGRPCDLLKAIVTDNLARTVTFHLRRPDADFLTKLALTFAVPAGTPGTDAGRRPLPATGPYLIDSYAKQALTLIRNPRFHEWSADAQPDGYPDAILFSKQEVPDPAAEARAIERGAADIATLAPPPPKAELDEIATRYPSQLHINTASATSYFFLNTWS
jgi:peptide/nickel transport system substrate-binding protein